MNTLQIDFVSDVSCPWCAVGLGALEQALQNLQGSVAADITFQPFELNPQMGPEGQDIGELMRQPLPERFATWAAQPAEYIRSVTQLYPRYEVEALGSVTAGTPR